MLVPTLDIDLVWHTHQCSPVFYKESSKSLAGKFLDHDDKIEKKGLDNGLETIKELWKVRFGDEYEKCTCWECECLLERVEKCLAEDMKFVEKDAQEVAEICAYYKELEEARRKSRALPIKPLGLGV